MSIEKFTDENQSAGSVLVRTLESYMEQAKQHTKETLTNEEIPIEDAYLESQFRSTNMFQQF